MFHLHHAAVILHHAATARSGRADGREATIRSLGLPRSAHARRVTSLQPRHDAAAKRKRIFPNFQVSFENFRFCLV